MLPDAFDVDRRPVLVVEDSADDFDTVLEAASRSRVSNRLVHAADADIARRLLASEPFVSFAFILLDYNLPGSDGLSFLRRLRSDPLRSRLPAVILTTSVNPGDRDVFYAAGANAFHVKAVQHSASLSTLGAIFDYWLRRVSLPGEAGSSFNARPAT